MGTSKNLLFYSPSPSSLVSSFFSSLFSAGLFSGFCFFELAITRLLAGLAMFEQIDQKRIKATHAAITCQDSTTCMMRLKLGNIFNFRQLQEIFKDIFIFVQNIRIYSEKIVSEAAKYPTEK
jgi:hypothetical protein